MLSWQEAHAAREGFVYQTSDWEGLFAGSRPSWQFAQLRMSWGNATVEKSLSEFALPTMWYGVPA